MSDIAFLAGDIGGTNLRLGLFDRGFRQTQEYIWSKKFSVREVGSLAEFLPRLLRANGWDGQLGGVCFGVAAPVAGKALVKLTNFDFVIDCCFVWWHGGLFWCVTPSF